MFNLFYLFIDENGYIDKYDRKGMVYQNEVVDFLFEKVDIVF